MDILLKQRMVGAIVLISLGVIFIPMLLSGKGDSLGDSAKSNIPPLPKYEIKKADIPPPVINSKQDVLEELSLAATAESKTSVPDTGKDAASASAAPARQTVETKVTETKAIEIKESPSTNKSVSVKDNPGSATNASTSISANINAVSDTSAKQVTSKSAAPASSDSPSNETPSNNTNKATTAMSTPVSNKPAATVEITSPNEITGWVVQIGSFESKENATQLRDQLRSAGYASFIEPRKGKTTVYRVRVGPEKRRSLAEKLQRELQQKQKIEGMVMHFPD